MRNVRLPMAVLVALQVIAVILYPLSYQDGTAGRCAATSFLASADPAIVGFNTGTLSSPGRAA